MAAGHVDVDVHGVVAGAVVAHRPPLPEVPLDGGVRLLEHEPVGLVLEEDVRLEQVLEEGVDAGACSQFKV